MSSKLKKAHKTHALAQTAGVDYVAAAKGGRAGANESDPALRAYVELCAKVPDPAERARLLGVGAELEEAWARGERLPLLRARRAAVVRALQHGR